MGKQQGHLSDLLHAYLLKRNNGRQKLIESELITNKVYSDQKFTAFISASIAAAAGKVSKT